MLRNWKIALIVLLMLGFVTIPRVGWSLDPYEINVILPMTGTGTFIGTEQMKALQAIATLVNKRGGLNGRSVKFVVADDQSNPQIAVQLAQTLINQHVPVILGPSLAGSCNAVTPLVQREGPVLYCLTNAGHPSKGSYVFATLYSTQDILAVGIRFFREHGWTRLAYIVSTDASGQDAEQGILSAVALPENKSVEVVDREHFAATDIGVGAQVARIKAANPQAIVAWATGTPAGTIFHGTLDAGLNLPTMTSPGNLNAVFFKQYRRLLPKDLYFAAIPYYASDEVGDRGMKRALGVMSDALATIQQKPDQIYASTWDPTLVVVDALRHLGTDVPASVLRDYLLSLHGWAGVNGIYDFRAVPQRGIGQSSIVMVRWDADKDSWIPASKFGGAVRK